MKRAIWIWGPLATLTVLASYAASATLSARWLSGAPPGCAFIAVAAAHCLWIVSTVQRRNAVLRLTAWLVCLRLASDAITFFPALALETTLLLAAFSAAPPLALAERLGNWRRAREAAMAQFVLTDGILPWITVCFRRFIGNRADPNTAAARQARAQILAELEDAEALAIAQRRRLP